ncbi:MAG TPA: DUF5606 domain-containing protein [Puia sp.]|nr:DUF5606 domain-containing protein [Puia sp.]
MEYNKIIAVTGLPGLYELVSSKADGAIVRSLDDKTTRFVSSRIHNFSHLESIEVYTVRDNVNLVDILKAMEVSTDKLPDERDAAALKNYFEKVYPDLDFSRVYSSDLKKMVKWFSVLKANHIEIKLSEPEEEEAADEVAEDVDGLEDGGEAAEKPAVGTKAKAEKPAAAKKATTGKEEKVAAEKGGKVTAGKGEKAATARKAAAEGNKPKKAAKKK